MKTLRKADKELISMVNEYRHLAGDMSTYEQAAYMFRQLSWLLTADDRELLGAAWRNSYVDNSPVELNKACDQVVYNITNN